MKFMEKRSFWSFCSVPLYHDFSNRTIAPVSTKIRAIYGNTFITKFMKRTRFSVRPNRLRCITISRKTLTCNVSFSLDVDKRLVIPWSRHIRMRIHRIYDNVEHTFDENVLLLNFQPFSKVPFRSKFLGNEISVWLNPFFVSFVQTHSRFSS